MKLISLAVLILGFSAYIIQARSFSQDENDTLYWRKDYQLQLTDFHGRVEPASMYTAVSVCPIICDYYTDSLTDTLCFRVYCFFDRKESWAKAEEADEALLAHEQVHFNIVEIYARIIKRKLEAYKKQGNITENGILKIINSLLAEKDRMQILYDKETNLSRNIPVQKKWSDKVHQLIDKKEIERFN